MAWLSIQQVEKSISSRSILLPTSFELGQFEKIAIAGETGAGKSTLLKIIGGHVQADKGQVLFEGTRVKGPEEQLLPGHKGIAYHSQHAELHNNYLVEEQIDYGNELGADELQQLVQVCQIDHLLKRKTNSGLSGGERQRIVLAKLLATRPKLLLLDEPFSNLDAPHKQIIRQVIEDMGKKLGITVMMVSHDAGDMLSWADRILVMQQGHLVQDATPARVYSQPVSAYAAGLFGEYQLLPAETAALLGLGHAPAGTQWITRPEDFLMNAPAAENKIEAVVRAIRYFGAYWLADMLHGESHFSVMLHHLTIEPGDIVQVSLLPGKGHLVRA